MTALGEAQLGLWERRASPVFAEAAAVFTRIGLTRPLATEEPTLTRSAVCTALAPNTDPFGAGVRTLIRSDLTDLIYRLIRLCDWR